MSEQNRARVFKGALEALQAQTLELIKQMDLVIEPFDESKEGEHHADTTLYEFDDALVVVVDARNEFIEAAEIDTETANLSWKEQK